MRKFIDPIGKDRQARQRAALNRAIAAVGSLRKLARLLDVKYQTIQGWQEIGTPIERCAQVETLVQGAVQCHELNEDWLTVTYRPFNQSQTASGDMKRSAP